MTLISLDLQSRSGKTLAKLDVDSEVRLYASWQRAAAVARWDTIQQRGLRGCRTPWAS